MQSLLPLISTVIAMVYSPVHLIVDCLAEKYARLKGRYPPDGIGNRLPAWGLRTCL
jgi:hypothetical protein